MKNCRQKLSLILGFGLSSFALLLNFHLIFVLLPVLAHYFDYYYGFFFFLLCCDLFSSLCLVLVAASLLLPSLHCSDCSLCRDLHLLSQHCAGVSSGLIKRDVSEMFVLSAAEDAATVSDFLLLIKC